MRWAMRKSGVEEWVVHAVMALYRCHEHYHGDNWY